jgi:hypothetical protein
MFRFSNNPNKSSYKDVCNYETRQFNSSLKHPSGAENRLLWAIIILIDVARLVARSE